MAGTDAAAASAKQGSGKGKTIALLAVVVVLAAGSAVGGAIGYQRFMAPKAGAPAAGEKHAPKKEAAHDAEEAPEEEPAEEAHEGGHKPPTVQLEAFVVDLRNGDEMHNLRIGLALEMKDKVEKEEEAKEMAKELVPRARDAAITYLRAVPTADIMDSGKLEEIRAELVKRIKKAIPKPKVKHVLFTDFVVQ